MEVLGDLDDRQEVKSLATVSARPGAVREEVKYENRKRNRLCLEASGTGDSGCWARSYPEAQDWGIAGHGRPGFHGSQPKGHIFLGAERDHLMDQLHSFIHSTNHY